MADDAGNGENLAVPQELFAPGKVEFGDLTPQAQRISQLRQQLLEQGVKAALAVLPPKQLANVNQLKDQLRKLHTEMRSLFEGAN